MHHSSPIRQLAAAFLTLSVLAAGVLLLDSDQRELRANPTQGNDLRGSEYLPGQSDLFEPGLPVGWVGENGGELVDTDPRAFRNHGLYALNVDLVTGTRRY